MKSSTSFGYEEATTSGKKLSAVKILIYVFLILISITYILPLLWVFNVSFKTNREIFSAPFALPKDITFFFYIHVKKRIIFVVYTIEILLSRGKIKKISTL